MLSYCVNHYHLYPCRYNHHQVAEFLVEHDAKCRDVLGMSTSVIFHEVLIFVIFMFDVAVMKFFVPKINASTVLHD
jgi:hypothetical protein